MFGGTLTAAHGTAQGDADFVDVEGARLGYRVEGHGPPCLVVGSSVYYPRVFSQALREQLRLLFVDLRQFVPSDPSFGPDRISIETYADDIEQVRQTLRLGDVVVMGHSIHGNIALEYARRHPEHVLGVAAVAADALRSAAADEAVDRLWDAEASPERKEILAHRRAELTPEVRAALSPAELFVRDFEADSPQRWYDPAYDGSWLWEGVVPNVPVMDRVYGELFMHYDLAQGPTPIRVPVLVAHGRYDFAHPPTLWDEHRHKLPTHTYVLFDRSSHTPPLEEPERFDTALLDWVRGLQK